MNPGNSLKAAFMAALVCMAVAVEAFPTCPQVIGRLSSCTNYIRGNGSGNSQPPPACCSAVKSLNSEARSPADRRAACQCLKSEAMGTRGINYGRAAAIPRNCGVTIRSRISLETNCSRVK